MSLLNLFKRKTAEERQIDREADEFVKKYEAEGLRIETHSKRRRIAESRVHSNLPFWVYRENQGRLTQVNELEGAMEQASRECGLSYVRSYSSEGSDQRGIYAAFEGNRVVAMAELTYSGYGTMFNQGPLRFYSDCSSSSDPRNIHKKISSVAQVRDDKLRVFLGHFYDSLDSQERSRNSGSNEKW